MAKTTHFADRCSICGKIVETGAFAVASMGVYVEASYRPGHRTIDRRAARRNNKLMHIVCFEGAMERAQDRAELERQENG